MLTAVEYLKESGFLQHSLTSINPLPDSSDFGIAFPSDAVVIGLSKMVKLFFTGIN